jgi:3-oxoacyl-[acyl-carrier-protein] synthase-3
MSHFYNDIGARIVGTGSFLPEKVLTNHDLPGLEKSNGAVERLLGAVERRAAAEQETCSDMIVVAANRILEDAGMTALDVDRIIVSATPGDYVEPSTASVVQYKLGAKCPSIDIGMSCVGWLAGLDYALRCIATGEHRILVLAGTIVSRGTPFFNPMHRAIFGDGAAGVLIEKSDQHNFLSGAMWTDGQYHEMITMPNHISVPTENIPEEYHGSFHMGDGRVIQKALRDNLPLGVENVLADAGITRDDIDVCFIHQPSMPLYKVAVKAVGVAEDKLVEDYAQYGNTISAELPISLDENVKSGRVKRGDTILKVTYGAGFSGGIMLYKF